MTSRGPQTLREGPETQTEFQSEYIGNLLTGAGSRNVYASNKILCAFQSVDLLLLHQWLVCTLLYRAILKLLMQYNCCLIYVLCAKCLMFCGKKIELDYINAINRFCHLCLLVKTYTCYMFYLIRHSNFILHQNVER